MGATQALRSASVCTGKTSLLTLKKMSALYQAPPKLVTIEISYLINTY